MSDGIEKLSRKTRERAYILANNAKKLGVPLGAVRFRPTHDYMCYWLTNSLDWVVIYCCPDGYVAELHEDVGGTPNVVYLAVRNIRHFLQHLKKHGYQDADVYFESTDNEGEVDLRSYLERDDD